MPQVPHMPSRQSDSKAIGSFLCNEGVVEVVEELQEFHLRFGVGDFVRLEFSGSFGCLVQLKIARDAPRLLEFAI
jgi:hypothetical protein